MKHLIISLILISSSLIPSTAQPFFSKEIGKDEVRNVYDHLNILENGDYLIAHMESRNDGHRYGWHRLTRNGMLIDSFLFNEPGLRRSSRNSTKVYSDTVIQLIKPLGHLREISLYASMLSGDSLFHYKHEWHLSPMPNIVWPNYFTRTPDKGYMIAGCVSYGQNRYATFAMKLDKEGNEIWTKVTKEYERIVGVRDYLVEQAFITSDVIELNGDYYYSVSLWAFYLYTEVHKIDGNGNLVWTSEMMMKGAPEASPDITTNADSTGIFWATTRVATMEEVNHDPFAPWNYDMEPMTFALLDTADGRFIWEHALVRTRLPDESDFVLPAACYHSNKGDYIITGYINRYRYGVVNHGGLLARVSAEGELLWQYYIADQFVNGREPVWLTGVIEDGDDIVAVGTIRGSQLPYNLDKGWIIRVGPQGCFEGAYCSGDTLMVTGPLVTSLTDFSTPVTADIQVYPNPVKSGQAIYLQNEGLPQCTDPYHISISGMNGRPVMDIVHKGDPGAGIPLPIALAPGVYTVSIRGCRDITMVAKLAVVR